MLLLLLLLVVVVFLVTSAWPPRTSGADNSHANTACTLYVVVLYLIILAVLSLNTVYVMRAHYT